MKLYLPFLLLIILADISLAASITIVPDADIVTNSWTTTPLWSKIADSAEAPDGTVITSPLNPSSTDLINFSLNEIVEGQVDQVIIIVHARRSSVAGDVSLNLSWFNTTGGLIASIDTGSLTTTLTTYHGTFAVAVNRTYVNNSFLLIIPSSSGVLPQIEIDAINLNLTTSNTTLKANGTITGPVTNFTGENFTLQGNCEANGLSSAENVYVMLQNSTDNVTFTTITTSNTEPIYANVSAYFIGILTDANSSSPTFQINATKQGTYALRIQCNGTNTQPRESNSSSYNFTANQSYGYLDVTLLQPSPTASTSNVARNMNFTIIANVTCVSVTNNPTAICGKINGTARYNFSSLIPDVQINATEGDFPFWTNTGNKTCGLMNSTNICSLNWSVNATSDVGRTYSIDVLFNSEDTNVTTNNTPVGNITITPCVVDFSLWGTAIDFGTLPPSTRQNSAPRNADNFYNITVNPGSCNTDFFIRGTNMTNSSFTNIIGVGNITWNNESNNYASSFNLTEENILVKAAVPQITNITTWYWINVPPVYVGIYNGTITISGVESV